MSDVQASSGTDPDLMGGRSACLLIIAVLLAALADALASSALTFGRLDMLGDTAATLDEFAGADFGYTAMKLIGFMMMPAMLGRVAPAVCLRIATGVMATACGLAVITTDTGALIVLRMLQGFAGGLILSAGQTVLLLVFARSKQPFVQALFATAAVVAPATLVGSFQGWIIDAASWTWIFIAAASIGFLALLFFVMVGNLPRLDLRRGRFDYTSIGLFMLAAFSLTYVLNQGSRWDWFEETLIVCLTILGVISLAAFLYRQIAGLGATLDFSVFRNNDFLFAFCTSFVAGAALFGSTYLIPAFSVTTQGLSFEAAGFMLLPSGIVFVATLLFWAVAFSRLKLKPLVSIPFGLGCTMIAMYLLSRSGAGTGAPDMMLALMVRGFGLGSLFLAITLIAFMGVRGPGLPSAVALFMIGRQTGGLMGVAWLETTIDHETVQNGAVLGAHLTEGAPLLIQRLEALSMQLVEGGLDLTDATRAAMSLLGSELSKQASVIAFDHAFFSIVVLFLAAIPVLAGIEIALKVLLSDRG